MQIDIEEIVQEWGYRCRRGYPVYGDSQDMVILREVLDEMHIDLVDNVSLLNEATPSRHLDAKYVPNPSYADKWKSIGITDLDAFIDSPLTATDITQISKGDTVYYISHGDIKKVDAATIAHDAKLVTAWRTDIHRNVVFVIHNSSTLLVIQYKGLTATDTDIKEGLAFALFNSSVSTPFTNDNFNDNIKELLQDLPKSKNLGDVAYSRVYNFVTRAATQTPNADLLSVFNETFSQAWLMKDYSDFEIERNLVFKDIRDGASQITNLPADKWCPGDVYLIKKGSYDTIMTAIQTALENSEIGTINNLFLTSWGQKNSKVDAVIIAASLKLAKAQAGKAKDYLRKFAEGDKVYNLSDDESRMDLNGIQLGIKRLRAKIAAILKSSSEVQFEYTPITDKILDEELARKKYTSLKLAEYLLSREDDPADALKGALQFGMSLTGVNPTFFKIVGNKTGAKAKYQEFESAAHISYMVSSPKKKSVIKVVDNNTANTIEFNGTVLLGAEVLDFKFVSRSNGYTQATLEIQRLSTSKTV